jgi:rSAM/selenodomain-associated transferase 1
MKRELIVMAKAPLIGYAKSRLIESSEGVPEASGSPPPLGGSLLDGRTGIGRFDAARVARLADAFIRDTLRVAERCTHEALSIVFAPPDSEPYFRAVAPSAKLVPQSGGDLGARLAAAVALAFDRGATRVVVIGTDTPHLPPERLDEAFDALAAADCVLGPARDGGYYLIGLTAPRPELFRGIEWGTQSVLAETVAVAAAQGLLVAHLPEERDIDERTDLDWLADALRAVPALCPHTVSVIGETPGANYPLNG